MVTETPWYAYLIAFVLGISVFSFFGKEFQPLLLALYFLFTGALLGYLWPQKSWRWGLWLTGPFLVFLGVSVLFAGGVEFFLSKEFPLLLLLIATPCLASFVLSRYKLESRGG
jgi:hypothetical protein